MNLLPINLVLGSTKPRVCSDDTVGVHVHIWVAKIISACRRTSDCPPNEFFCLVFAPPERLNYHRLDLRTLDKTHLVQEKTGL